MCLSWTALQLSHLLFLKLAVLNHSIVAWKMMAYEWGAPSQAASIFEDQHAI
jgi:hypothetical protein